MYGGIIPAAGVSSRMGSFKPLLPIGDTTLIGRTIEKMRTAGIEDIVVVTGFNHEELEKYLKKYKVKCVYNAEFYKTQMLDSIKLAIKALDSGTERVLLSPVDVSVGSDEVYRKMLGARSAFARPVYEGRSGHPVMIRRSLFGCILRYEGEGGLRGAVESSGKKPADVNVSDSNILLDADTPEDYRRILHADDVARGEGGRLHPEISMGLSCGDIIDSDKVVLLLKLVDATGSLRKSAAAMHMSYTKVWKLVREIDAMSKAPFIERVSGGEDGGRSYLTDAGRDFLSRYEAMKTETDRSMRQVFDKYFGEYRIS